MDFSGWTLNVPMSWNAVSSLLQACTQKKDIQATRNAYGAVISVGLISMSCIADHLIRLFVSCGSLLEAESVFSKVSCPTVYTWHAIISAHTKLGESNMAIHLYFRMLQEGIAPNKYVYLSVLKACSNTKDVCDGRKIHDDIIRSALESDLTTSNSMVDMYSKCGSVEEACCVFERLHEKDIASWGAMIAGFAAHSLGIKALETLRAMQENGLLPNSVVFLSALRACSTIEALEEGMFLHDQINRCGLQSDEVVGSALIDMYSKCGSLEEAVNIFTNLPNQDVVSWSAMIAGYAEWGQGDIALCLYEGMQSEGIKPSKVTFISILKACIVIEGLMQGRLIHSQLIIHNHDCDMAVGNALIDMYAKCGSLEEAQKVFDKMVKKDGITWNAIIQGYAEHNSAILALNLYAKMQNEAFKANKVTFPIILRACCSTREGRQIHYDIIKRSFESDLTVKSALVDMYAKCGVMDEARNVFDTMCNKDIISWGTILSGYAQCGDWASARQAFLSMQRQGCKPDGWIFTSILTACSHAGEVEEGQWYFTSMMHEHGIKPTDDHFNCMIDLLGRAGCLQAARDIVQSIPSQVDVNGQTSLLTSCRMYGNKWLGNECFLEVTELESCDCIADFGIMQKCYTMKQCLKTTLTT